MGAEGLGCWDAGLKGGDGGEGVFGEAGLFGEGG